MRKLLITIVAIVMLCLVAATAWANIPKWPRGHLTNVAWLIKNEESISEVIAAANKHQYEQIHAEHGEITYVRRFVDGTPVFIEHPVVDEMEHALTKHVNGFLDLHVLIDDHWVSEFHVQDHIESQRPETGQDVWRKIVREGYLFKTAPEAERCSNAYIDSLDYGMCLGMRIGNWTLIKTWNSRNQSESIRQVESGNW